MAGNRPSVQLNQSVMRAAYDDRNRLLSAEVGGPLVVRGHLNEPGTAKVNNRDARMFSGNAFLEVVDAVRGPNTLTVEARDASGNLATQHYQVNVTGTNAAFSYDANGNLTSKTEGPNLWTYEWNAENQLTRVARNGSEMARFAYDPLGRRVEKVAGGVTTSYLYDGQDILRETTSDGTNYTYVHGPGIDEPLARVDGSGNLAYYHADGLGSIVRMTDNARNVIETRQYDAWGNLEVAADRPGHAFTGREWDAETGLYYYRARYYDPRMGRFISEDPMGFAGGDVNLYAYVGNDPVSFTDPSGLVTFVADPNSPLGQLQNMSTLEKLLFPLDFVMPLSVVRRAPAQLHHIATTKVSRVVSLLPSSRSLEGPA